LDNDFGRVRAGNVRKLAVWSGSLPWCLTRELKRCRIAACRSAEGTYFHLSRLRPGQIQVKIEMRMAKMSIQWRSDDG